jgi:hypothetical protein
LPELFSAVHHRVTSYNNGKLRKGLKLGPKCRGGIGERVGWANGIRLDDRGAKGRGNRPARARVPTTDDERNRQTSSPKQKLMTETHEQRYM